MFKFIIELSVKFRWFIVLATALVAAYGLLELTRLTIDAVPKQHVAVDGEVITQTPIRVSIAREALLLMGPRDLPQLEDLQQA